jgi:hypothetical protein
MISIYTIQAQNPSKNTYIPRKPSPSERELKKANKLNQTTKNRTTKNKMGMHIN